MTKPLPLVDLTTIYGATVTFDRTKISVLLVGPAPPPFHGLAPAPLPGTATEVSGVSPNPIFVADPPAAILSKFALGDEFLTVTQTNGHSVWIKAAAISWISPNASPDIPHAKCSVEVGGALFPILEDYAVVRQQIEAIRQKDDKTNDVA